MAGIKLRFSDRVPASSVIEVVISMIIILIVFTTAMMMVANVMRTSLSSKKIQATSLLKDLMITAEQNQAIESTTLTLGDFQIKQDAKSYQGDPGLNDIHLIAYDNNHQQVAALEKVIIKR
ncbi:MAG TPA: hypothetical protein VNW51_00935 [Mucilaginibacter sp.]|jgi:hypothetical protein|nr:hypothetical protein [Mucilaginibacter sp.]